MSAARPTAEQRALASALTAHYAREAQRADQRVTRAAALAGAGLAIGAGVIAALVLLAWGDCAASGAAMCGAVITPTRLSPTQRARAWWQQIRLRLAIRWAEQDLRWLENDVASAQEWIDAAPAVLAWRRAHLEALRVQLISADLDARRH